MAFKKYLKHPTTQTAVDDIIADIYPILQEHYEKKEDKEMLLNLTTFIMETTPDQGLFSTKH